MQHKITKPSLLLNKCGELVQRGYATSPILDYRREDVANSRLMRLKEWDYYLIYNEDYGIALTLGKASYLGLISASVIDFTNKSEKTKSVVRILDINFSMPESSVVGDIYYKDTKVELSFMHVDGARELHAKMKNFDDGSELELDIVLSQQPRDSMVIATPFRKDRKAFYYNQKIIGMRAFGKARFGDKIIDFQEGYSFGLLDWGRGVWPRNVTWYWGAAQGIVEDSVFGFNLGYGFGNTSAATENMLFYNGIANKLEDVIFKIPKNAFNQYDYMKPWIINSSDRRLEMTFQPTLERVFFLSAVVISTDQHQVFGEFSGRAVLDDNTVIEFKNLLGFAERVENNW